MFPVNKKYETEMCTTNTYEIQGQGQGMYTKCKLQTAG